MNTMKKTLIILAVVVGIVLVAYAGLSMVVSRSIDRWEATAERQVRNIIFDLDELSESQMRKYVSANASPEYLQAMMPWLDSLGSLEKIETIELQTRTTWTSFTGQGISHQFHYQAKAQYSQALLTFDFNFSVRDGLLYTNGFEISDD
ncbi:hypothetical protein BGP77_03925 [Saccharospirillum sp. MSK14-1]|uniref:hypothetical protein n=1 Tax=Saccharospirillum sp. MSK14-1 TaxID=1897632 RepID=UPI000D3BEEDD|nr:hypothetical protein [Saccharospirillum sp. MSK14-1]PTY36457.1 hypothetical protein BGP77_03925 [Saccharospirillum sp. MSK14-1]